MMIGASSFQIQAKKEAISSYISRLDKFFDLVMMFDEYDKSLILLADVLGWDLEQIKYIPHRKSQNHDLIKKIYKTLKSKKEVMASFGNWQYGDQALYKFFKSKFQEQWDAANVDGKLDQNLEKFQEMQAEVKEKCPYKLSAPNENRLDKPTDANFFDYTILPDAQDFCYNLIRNDHDFVRIHRFSVLSKLSNSK